MMYIYKAQVIAIYDADTITAKIDLGFHVSVVHKLRLAGIDTPEMRGVEREEGKKSREALCNFLGYGEDLILPEIKVETAKTGKFGRWIAVIYTLEGTNVNLWLLDNGYAKKYGE